MADTDEIEVIKNERGIGTGETRSGVEPRPTRTARCRRWGTP